ncbi:MAG: hypothetical protein ABWZ99_01710 [Ilumatobacteraceae bacterium]
MLAAAADGRFPPADGAVEVLPSDAGWRAVVSMTGHAYVLADVAPGELRRRGADGYGGASQPAVLRWLAGPGGTIGSLDVVLVAVARSGPTLDRRRDLDGHPRVQRALAHRRDVEVYGDDDGLVVVGRGLVGRWEVSVERYDTGGGGGHGRRLIRSGLARIPAGERCWAQVAPGNAASLRAFLACGFVPIGSEVLIDPPSSR